MSTSPVRADSNLEVLRESNRSLRRFELENGMICLVKPDRSAPVVAIQIWVGTGAIHEEAYLGAGLSHYMEHMIFKGTPTRGPADISRQIDDAGGDINAYTAQDRTVFVVDLPSKNWQVGIDVLSDAVMHAALPEDEWEREKQVILREFAMGNDDPDRTINKLLWRTAYRVHPYKYPVIGYEEVFRTMTRDNLEAFFRRNYVPDNMITVIVGNVDPDQVEASLRTAFKDFTRRARAPVVVPQEPTQVAPRDARETGPYNISRLQWSYHTVPLSSPDAPALDLLASVVGHGRSSRLSKSIKEDKKLVHEIDAWSYTARDPGLFGISAVFDPTNEAAAVDAIQAEVDSWLTKPVTSEELDKAKRMMMVSELGGLQTMSGTAGSYASGEFYAGSPRYNEVYLETLERVTPQMLQDVAKRYLAANNRTIVILAPEETNAAAAAAADREPDIEAKKIVLSNGIPLIVREDHRLPFVYAAAALNGGLLSENETNNGITQLMVDLLTRGTKTRTAEQIAEQVEERGASLSPFAGRNSFGLQLQCLAQDTDAMLDLFADGLLNSTFPEGELEKQRDVQIAGIEQQQEQPMFLAQENLRTLLYPNHPYRFNQSGTKQNVAGISREDIVAHVKRHVVTGNLVLSIFGDITADKAKALAETCFASMGAGEAPERKLAAAVPALPARTKRREQKEQAIVLLGFPGVDVRDERLDALSILQKSMSGLSSDLGIEIREKRGLAYYVGAFNQAGIEPGMFVCYAGTREEAAGDVEDLMNQEIERITGKGLREEEFARAREQILAGHEMSLQNNADLAQSCALNELYGLGWQYTFDLPRRIKAQSIDHVKKAAASVLRRDQEAVSLVLPEPNP
ncbi:MAG: pitrilysin family protein [bacterium]